jgi:hypothetical protein
MDNIVSNVTDRIIILNSSKNTLYRGKEELVVSTEDMKSDSINSKLANPTD